jgi:hypothetical protein
MRFAATVQRACAREDGARRELMNIKEAACGLGVFPSTFHRLPNDGVAVGEQLKPEASWRIGLTNGLRACFSANAGEGSVPMREAIRALRVSRQTVPQRSTAASLTPSASREVGETSYASR